MQKISTKNIEMLQIVLANTYALYLKTQNYHWNVSGENFYYIHTLLEKHYEELAEAIDEIAETIVSLGGKAYASFSKYHKLSKITEGNENEKSALRMIKDLAESHKILADIIEETMKENRTSEVINSVLSDRMVAHTKMIWMLESHIK